MQGINRKLSSDPSMMALATKSFMKVKSLKRYQVISMRALKWGNFRMNLSRELMMGMRELMRLQILKIQMNLILVPLLKTSFSGMIPPTHVLKSSSLMDSFMKQLYKGTRISMLINPSRLSLLSSFMEDWMEVALVKILIFFDIRISDKSYLVLLESQIQNIMIFIFLPTLFFSSRPFNSSFIRLSSPVAYLFWSKEQQLPRNLSLRVSVSNCAVLNYFWIGDSLKKFRKRESMFIFSFKLQNIKFIMERAKPIYDDLEVKEKQLPHASIFLECDNKIIKMKMTITTSKINHLSLKIPLSQAKNASIVKENKPQHYVRNSIITKNKNIQMLQHQLKHRLSLSQEFRTKKFQLRESTPSPVKKQFYTRYSTQKSEMLKPSNEGKVKRNEFPARKLHNNKYFMKPSTKNPSIRRMRPRSRVLPSSTPEDKPTDNILTPWVVLNEELYDIE